MTTAYIDGYVWEILHWPKCGVSYDYHTIHDIYYYNSLEDRDFSRENKIACIQIPEDKILNINNNLNMKELTEEKISVKEFVRKHKDLIVKNKYPIIRKQGEIWYCDLNMLFYDVNKKWNV
jgi:hypothetical protein